MTPQPKEVRDDTAVVRKPHPSQGAPDSSLYV